MLLRITICDTKQLADIFENFREISMNNDELDPAHYYKSPSLLFSTMLKYTKVSLDLMVLFI